MELRIPEVVAGRKAICSIKGFKKRPGDVITSGEALAELRLELEDDAFSDCPVIYYGDLVAGSDGRVISVLSAPPALRQGDVLAEVASVPPGKSGDFPVTFQTF